MRISNKQITLQIVVSYKIKLKLYLFTARSDASQYINKIETIQRSKKYVGNLAPCKYKLHAVEVHQYIPLPDTPEPEFFDILPSDQVLSKTLEMRTNDLNKNSISNNIGNLIIIIKF